MTRSTFNGVVKTPLSKQATVRLSRLITDVPPDMRDFVLTTLTQTDVIDLNEEINSSAPRRGEDPMRVEGVHRRGLIGLHQVVEHPHKLEFPYGPEVRPRERDEMCRESCCSHVSGGGGQMAYLARSISGGRNVAVLGYTSDRPAFCARDFLVMFVTSACSDEHTTFTLEGFRKDPSGPPKGVRTNAHPELWGALSDLKRTVLQFVR